MWFPKNIIYFKSFFHCRSLLWIILSVITDQMGLPWWLSGKEPAFQCRRCGFHPWVGEIPWRRKRQPIPIFLPGKSHGQRSLAGYTTQSWKESDTTKQCSTDVKSNNLKMEIPGFRWYLQMQPQRMNVWPWGQVVVVGWTGRLGLTYTHYLV